MDPPGSQTNRPGSLSEYASKSTNWIFFIRTRQILRVDRLYLGDSGHLHAHTWFPLPWPSDDELSPERHPHSGLPVADEMDGGAGSCHWCPPCRPRLGPSGRNRYGSTLSRPKWAWCGKPPQMLIIDSWILFPREFNNSMMFK